MKKLLLILGLTLLLAATASAQEWGTRLVGVYQCNSGTPMTIYQSGWNGATSNCLGTTDPYDPKLGYLLTQSYLQSNNMLGSAYKIVQCGQNILTGQTPNQWGWRTYRLDPCPAGWMDSTQFPGYSLKQQAPGTREVFLCTNNQDPFRVYSLSTDPNCRSGQRAGYTRVSSLGFWPQSTDFLLPPPQQPPAPAEQQVCCLVTRTRDDGRIQREANVERESRCNEYTTRPEFTIEKLASAKCEEEVCCESEGRRDRQKFRDCYKRNGVGVNVPLAECKGVVPPPTQPPAVCTVTQADNDALLATLSQLENERDSYAKKQVCCGIEVSKAGKQSKKDVKVMSFGECNNAAKKGTIFGLYAPDKCEAKVCCELPNKPAMMSVFRECIREGQEATAEKCAAPPAPQCGNNIVELPGEECDPPKAGECTATCKKILDTAVLPTAPPTAPRCGDGTVNQPSEQCEPPSTTTCDASCKTILPPNTGNWVLVGDCTTPAYGTTTGQLGYPVCPVRTIDPIATCDLTMANPYGMLSTPGNVINNVYIYRYFRCVRP